MFSNNLLMAAASISAAGGYEIAYSCRFNDNDSANLEKTGLSDGTSATQATFSMWFKRGDLSGVIQTLFSAKDTTSGDDANFYITTANKLELYCDEADGGTVTQWNASSYVLRDPHAWYHLVFQIDTTQAAAGDRYTIWLNGVDISTSFTQASTIEQSGSTPWNSPDQMKISEHSGSAIRFFDGYMSQVAFLDGQVLEATSFGETDDNGVWRPIDITGLTYTGTNSFLLDFANDSDLGNDISGNSNDFTSSGLASNDQMIDTPTNNFCVGSSIWKPANATALATLSDGNLHVSFTDNNNASILGSISIPGSGKWYWEWTIDAGGNDPGYQVSSGIVDLDAWGGGVGAGITGAQTGELVYWSYTQQLKEDGSIVTDYGSTPGVNTDILAIALDLDNGALYVRVEGTWLGTGDPESGASRTGAGTTWTPGEKYNNVGIALTVDGGSVPVGTWNFGQLGFSGSVPDGYSAINTTNLPVSSIPDGSVHVQPHAYTGTGIAHTETLTGNSDLTSSDIVFIKNRDEADYGHISNIIRAAVATADTRYVDTARGQGEVTDANAVTSLGDSDAFDLGTGAGGWNDDSENFASWIAYLDGTTGATNSNGNVDATVAANTAAGISLGIYTPTGTTAARQVGHGLNAAPEVVMAWNLTDATEWSVFGCTALGWTKAMYGRAVAPSTSAVWWNDLAPTYSGTASEQIINFGNQLGIEDKTFQFIAMHSVAGFSKFISYTGSGNADGPLVILDFKPAVVWIIRTNVSVVTQVDINISPYNMIDNTYGDMWGAAAETTNNVELDILSNGIKIRHSGGNINDTGVTYGVMAWAKNPFGGFDGTFGTSGGVSPATAR